MKNPLMTHLARAAAAKANHPSTVDDEAGDQPLPARDTDSDEGRCTASVVRGQRCRRPAGGDGTLCAGHAAMAG